MNFILCQIETAAKLADQFGDKSDRWLVIAGAILFIGCVAIAVRWLVGRFEKSSDTVVRLCDDAHKVNQDLAVAMNRNTTALIEGTEERRKTREVMERLQQKL